MTQEEPVSLLTSTVKKAAEKLPFGKQKALLDELDKIKELMMKSRPPKLVIIGRRGAGKSALVNAIFGERVAEVGAVTATTGRSVWHDFQNEKGGMRILDTRGTGDKTKPETADFSSALDEIKFAVNSDVPDAILFLCKAKEVDARIGEDIRDIEAISSYIETSFGFRLPVLAVVTQVDELDPKRVEPPYDNPVKQSHITAAVDTLRTAFYNRNVNLLNVIPVSAYAEYDEQGKVVYHNYWNVDKLVDYLVEVLPADAQLEMARLTRLKTIQKKLAKTLIRSVSVVCAGIAATPMPVADIVPITTAQIGMIIGIAHISGRKLTQESAREFLVALGLNVGAGFVLRQAARAVVKIAFAGVGEVISAGIAYGGTYAIGTAAVAYFIDKKPIEEARSHLDITRYPLRKMKEMDESLTDVNIAELEKELENSADETASKGE